MVVSPEVFGLSDAPQLYIAGSVLVNGMLAVEPVQIVRAEALVIVSPRFPVFLIKETLEPPFPEIRSGLPSPSASVATTLEGADPLGIFTLGVKEIEPVVLIFSKTEMLAPPRLPQKRSGTPSPLRSVIPTLYALLPEAKSTFAKRETVPAEDVFLKTETKATEK